ncbi:MAG: tetraacyldisaccharide 4'-kinase [Candidatus Omnitrophica bacterium]|nr:tetraacyldisaccharide 4'-kinase [Candidatus Omnitrophota bacterium]
MRQYFLNVVTHKRNGIDAKVLRMLLLVGSYCYRVLLYIVREVSTGNKKKLPHPVISVGNITWGGTGKTPLIGLLIEQLNKQGKKIAVLMRGYGNDEDVLLRTQYPHVAVICGKKRYKNAMAHLAVNKTDIFLLDDGFQQWELCRDFDIVTVNCLDPWGNGHLIPRGSLREPISTLQRAHCVILTNASLVSEEMRTKIKNCLKDFIAEENILEGVHKPLYFYKASTPQETIPLETFQGKKALVFSGIGSPTSLKLSLEKLGVTIVQYFTFDDHHVYSSDDFLAIQDEKKTDSSLAIITTEKDFMRDQLRMKKELNPYILKITFELQDMYGTFSRRLDRILGS